MKKVKRNDPCPCGSGKKYKKCHGASNNVDLGPERYNQELDKLHAGLMDFAVNNYKVEIGAFIQKNPQPALLEDEELVDFYVGGLTAWFVMNKPVKDEQTIFELYYEREQKKIRYEQAKEAFEAWKEATSSIFKVTTASKEEVIVLDLRSNQSYNLRILEEAYYEKDDMLIGVLLPFVSQHTFLLAENIFEGNEAFVQTLETLAEEEFVADYPNILGKLLNGEVEGKTIEWTQPMYAKVADIFTDHMRKKSVEPGFITTGVEAWEKFTLATEPMIRKPEAYAAALDYAIQDALDEDDRQSQKEIAEEYGVSPNTVSRNASKLNESIDMGLAQENK